MRTNPFQPIYDICNRQDVQHKLASLPPMPLYIDVELTNTCNFNCLFCYTGTGQQTRKKGFMTDEVYYRFLDQAAAHGIALRFVRWGEPTLHPRWIDYLRAARERGLLTHMTTNGSRLDAAAIRALVELPLDSIKFSFQGIDRRTYREMRNTDFFEQLLQVLGRLQEARGERDAPYMHVSTTITYETPEQVAAFKERIAPLCDSFQVGRTVLERIDVEKVSLSAEDRARLAGLQQHESVIKSYTVCHQVFDVLALNWDGSVSACCSDYNNLMPVGDIARQSLGEIWHGPQLERYRRLLAAMQHAKLPLCRTCYDYNQKRVKGSQQL